MSIMWSRDVGDLTYDALMNRSDLVAIVEISTPSTTYFDKHAHFTLHKAKVIEFLIGNLENDEIQIYTLGGYNPKTETFYHIEGCPKFVEGDKWLVFLKKKGPSETWGDEKIELLKDAYYLSPAFMGLKIVDEKLYSININDNFPPPQLQIKGLSLNMFKSLYLER